MCNYEENWKILDYFTCNFFIYEVILANFVLKCSYWYGLLHFWLYFMLRSSNFGAQAPFAALAGLRCPADDLLRPYVNNVILYRTGNMLNVLVFTVALFWAQNHFSAPKTLEVMVENRKFNMVRWTFMALCKSFDIL